MIVKLAVVWSIKKDGDVAICRKAMSSLIGDQSLANDPVG